jgi:ribonuclease HI
VAKGWQTSAKKPVLNRQAIEMIAERLQGRDVSWEHVKGHSGHVLNERVDLLARTQAEVILAARPPAGSAVLDPGQPSSSLSRG